MKKLVLVAMALAVAGPSLAAETRRMSRAVLEDKVRGGWAGQMIGVSYGAPTEFKALGRINDGEIKWSPEMVENAIHQDDLYVEMTFAEVMDRLGLSATTEQYGDMFRDSRYSLWHANAGARRNLARGIKAPMSGNPKYNIHANDIDFQIESDFIGLMCPGLPRLSSRYADRVGHVMNYGDGVYGGMLFGAMYAAAFFESEPRSVVEQALLSLPAESGYAAVIRDTLAWHAQHPDDWRKVWQLLEEKWDKDDVCPDGALSPFNIDAKLNGAYVVLGLLYGKKDFARTVEIATRAGQDSDCNPSSAAGILGVMLGYQAIPDRFKSGIPPLADTKFEYTTFSFNSIVASTLARAEKNIKEAGGTVSASEVVIPVQAPVAARLEQWDSGVPVARVELDDPRWSWKGGWKAHEEKNEGSSWKVKEAGGAGDEASIRFEGTGVALAGTMSQRGGRADVWLDGGKAGEIEAWIPERTYDDDYWHVTGLARGTHTVRLVVRGDADPRSSGRRVLIERAIVYDTAARAPGRAKADKPDLGWFTDARLGIFIHWGIYSEGNGSESWAFRNGDTPYDAYMAQAKSFTAAHYDPLAWAELFRAAGARYAVLTSKHHDGFALWDTAQSRLNAKDGSPAGRDLVGPFCDALRQRGLKVGLYFSHLDWSHPDYASVLKEGGVEGADRGNRFSYPQGPEDPKAWERFLVFHRAQIREIAERFRPDLFWFDGDWERSAAQWRMPELREQIRHWLPDVVLNSRMAGYGDYATPEQALPVRPPEGPWELCMTINDSWGYQKKDRNFKTVRQCVRLLTETASQGGNLLLDVGPTSDGRITPEQEQVLRGLGRWTHKHEDALYGTRAGIPKEYYYGPSLLSPSRDVLYLVAYDRPADGLWVKGIRNAVRRTSVVGGGEVDHRLFMHPDWAGEPGILIVDLPAAAVDPDATVVKVELDGPLTLADAGP